MQRSFLGFFPILTWLASYNVREDLLADVLAGITLAVFHVPQGELLDSRELLISPLAVLHSSGQNVEGRLIIKPRVLAERLN